MIRLDGVRLQRFLGNGFLPLIGALGIMGMYVGVLARYGTAIPMPIAPEEFSLANVAQNLIQGRGFVSTVPSELFPFPDRPQPVYMPVFTYTLALGAWGGLWGFDLLPLRWLSRGLNALNLVLLFLLARRCGVPAPFALLATLWTALDIPYQLIGNIVRPDAFVLTMLLLSLFAFTEAWERDQLRMWAVTGLSLAVALFAHAWLALGLSLWLALMATYRSPLRGFPLLAAPALLGALLWALRGMQDVGSFTTIARLALHDKTGSLSNDAPILLLGLTTLHQTIGVLPSNSPIWLVLLFTANLAKVWGGLPLRGWQMGGIWAMYGIAYIGRHHWYVGVFSPFGYLATAALLAQLFHRTARHWERPVILLLSIAWLAYQAGKVQHCWIAAPAMQASQEAFFADLARELPPGISVWLSGIPSPVFHLHRFRPDLSLYPFAGYFTFPYPDFFRHIDAIIADEIVSNYTRKIPPDLLPGYRAIRCWTLRGIRHDYGVQWLEPIWIETRLHQDRQDLEDARSSLCPPLKSKDN